MTPASRSQKNTTIPLRPLQERITDFASIDAPYDPQIIEQTSTGCMTCGVPFCNWGCPLGNLMPDINQMVSQGKLERAFRLLERNNPFPEITSRICPALCESACASGINGHSVPVRDIERLLADTANAQGWICPNPPRIRREEKIAIIGSGPAGLAAAWLLNQHGFHISVYEKNHLPGGLLRYGIPDFKLPKDIIDRRIAILEREGITFLTGHPLSQQDIKRINQDQDATIVAIGCEIPWQLDIPGVDNQSIIYAMNYLCQQNKVINGEASSLGQLNAANKDVVIVGAGDTGKDCASIAVRQGAKSITLVDIMPAKLEPGDYPDLSFSLHPAEPLEDHCQFLWQHKVLSISCSKGEQARLSLCPVKWKENQTHEKSPELQVKKQFSLPADLIIGAMGFQKSDYLEIANEPHVFLAGDIRTGQSLVVSSMADGLAVAQQIIDRLKH